MKKMKFSLLLLTISAVILTSCGGKEEGKDSDKDKGKKEAKPIEEEMLKKVCDLQKLEVRAKFEKDDKKKDALKDDAKKLSDEINRLRDEIQKKAEKMLGKEKEEYNFKWQTRSNELEKDCSKKIEDLELELNNKY